MLTIRAVPGDGVVRSLCRSVIRPDADIKTKLCIGIRITHNLFLNLQLTVLISRRYGRNRRQCKLHVAGGAGKASLGVVELERMFAGIAFFDIVPQVHICADGTVHTADITYETAVQEYPHIVITEEVVLQRTHIVLRQFKLHAVLHAEHVVMI